MLKVLQSYPEYSIFVIHKTIKHTAMKIIRKQYGDNGELKSKCVVRENATLRDFKALQERAMYKAEWGNHGTPSITNWTKMCIVHTKTGQSFEFLLIN